MPVSTLFENFKRQGANTVENGFDNRDRHRAAAENSANDQRRKNRCWKSLFSRRVIPWTSIVALLVTWSGLFLFCVKMYFGLLDVEELCKGMFNFLVQYLRMGRDGIVVLGVIMAASTGSMLIVGFFATLHCDRSYRGRFTSCLCSVLGGRLLCGLFWLFGYLLNFCWLAILSLLVFMSSAYFAFLPVCLPQSGTVDQLCFNFTLIASMITGGPMSGPAAVSLLLCGGAIDKFCKLTKAIVPWYWGAYAGCLVVLLGLALFSGGLAANFAHAKHAVRYRKIRRRSKAQIQWSKDWRIKSIKGVESKGNDSGISTISETVTSKAKKKLINGFLLRRTTLESESSSSSDFSEPETDSFFESQENLVPAPPAPLRRTTSNGSIIVQKRQPNQDTFLYKTTAEYPPTSTPHRPDYRHGQAPF